jgi:hypothetical protein
MYGKAGLVGTQSTRLRMMSGSVRGACMFTSPFAGSKFRTRPVARQRHRQSRQGVRPEPCVEGGILNQPEKIQHLVLTGKSANRHRSTPGSSPNSGPGPAPAARLDYGHHVRRCRETSLRNIHQPSCRNAWFRPKHLTNVRCGRRTDWPRSHHGRSKQQNRRPLPWGLACLISGVTKPSSRQAAPFAAQCASPAF